MTQPGGGEPLRKITLTDNSSVSYDFILEGGDSSIVETFLSPNPVTPGGAGRFGDFDPGFGYVEQRDWSRGFGSDYFTSDPARFFDSGGAWTATPELVMPQLKWYWAKGFKSYDIMDDPETYRVSMSGSYINSFDYATVFTASASYSVVYAYVWITSASDPVPSETVSMKLWSDSSGTPGTVIGTSDTQDLSDLVLAPFQHYFVRFTFSTPVALTSGTTYHLSVHSSSNKTRLIVMDYPGTSKLSYDSFTTTYSSSLPDLWFRLAPASVNRYIVPFHYYGGSLLMAYSHYYDGTSSELFINGDTGKATGGSASTLVDTNEGLRGAWTTDQWAGASVWITVGTGSGQVRTISSNNTTGTLNVTPDFDTTPDTTSRYVICDTDDWYTLPTTGLGVVEDMTLAKQVLYFAQGSGDNIRRVHIDYSASPPAFSYADDGTNTADKIGAGGGYIWKATDESGVVYYAPTQTWGTDLTFTATSPGLGTSHPVTNFYYYNNEMYVFKTHGVWKCDPAKAKWVNVPVGIDFMPDRNNGQAVGSKGEFLYFNWAYALERLSGSTVDHLDPNAQSGMPEERRGPVSAMASHPAGLFFTVDAGTDGISSVNIFDGLSFHEACRLDITGERIQSLLWHPVPDRQPVLWFGWGDELVYQNYPQNHTNPLKDSNMLFQEQFYWDTATMDMGASGLKKLFRGIGLIFEKFVSGNTSARVHYQADNDIGGTSWTNAGTYTAASSTVVLFDNALSTLNALGNIQRIRLRFVVNDTSPATPAAVTATVLKGFGRTPTRKQWSFPVRISETMEQLGSGDPTTLMSWLDDKAENAEALLMTSEHPRLDNQTVIIIPRSVRTNWIDSTNSSFDAVVYLEVRET